MTRRNDLTLAQRTMRPADAVDRRAFLKIAAAMSAAGLAGPFSVKSAWPRERRGEIANADIAKPAGNLACF